jgi:hypothetical protein
MDESRKLLLRRKVWPHFLRRVSLYIDALAVRRPAVLAEAWETAWKTGKEWRRKLESGRPRPPSEVQETLKNAIEGE